MALFDRMVGYAPGFAPLPDGENKIAVHQFMAGLAELARGQVTRAQLITAFGITLAEETELDFLINKGQGLPAGQRFEYGRVIHDSLLLGEARLLYTTSAAFQARINAV